LPIHFSPVLPNHPRYQLRYTRIYEIVLLVLWLSKDIHIHIIKHPSIISEFVDKVNPLVGKTATNLSLSQQLAFFAGIDPVITVRRPGRRRNHVSKRGPPYLRRVIRMAST